MSEMKFTAPDGTEIESLEEVLEHAFPDQYQRGMRRNRPYEGQQPKRAKEEIKGITMRDLTDALVRACCLSAGGGLSEKGDQLYEQACRGEEALLCQIDLYDLPWDEIDIIAVAQNLGCEVERLMGIYPNVGDPRGRE